MIRIFYLYTPSLIFLLISCSYFANGTIKTFPNQWTGKRFLFSELGDDYKKTDNFNKIWSKTHKTRFTPYYKFLDKDFIIVGTHKTFKNDYLVIEDKRKKRFKMLIQSKSNQKDTIPSYFLFDDVLQKAKAMIGKYIWLNNTYDRTSFFTKSGYQFRRFEKVMVEDYLSFQNSFSDYPVWLKISNQLGAIGFVRFNGEEGRVGVQDHYYLSNPLPKSWGSLTIQKIINNEIEIGMEDRQVRISIGNPNEINITSSRHGIGEQWVYWGSNGNKIYYQFEYGILSYISK